MTTSKQRIVPVILSGGGGSRLWPLSRQDRPKQFLPLINGKSTFANALVRIADPHLFAPPFIITANDFALLAADEMHAAGLQGHIVLEPRRRDSAAAIAVAAHIVSERTPASLMLVLAADHFIADAAAFRQTVQAGMAAAESGYIVTFGIKPDNPSPNYGYIETGLSIDAHACKVSRFIEKPDAAKAQTLLTKGCLWNSGNFLFRSDVLLGELASFEPGIIAAAAAAVADSVVKQEGAVTYHALAEQAFAASPAKSIDFAVMERTAKAAVVPAQYEWSDVGSFDALWNLRDKDVSGSVITGDALLQDASNSYVSSDGMLTVVIGLSDIAVIATPDAVLVAPRQIGAELRSITTALDASPQWRRFGRHHQLRRKSWGTETVLVERGNPGMRLSLLKLDPGSSTRVQAGQAGTPGTVQLTLISGSGHVATASGVDGLGPGKTNSISADEPLKVSNTGDTCLEFLVLWLSS